MFKRFLVLAILNDKKIELHIPTIITRLEIQIIFPIMDISSLTQSGIQGPSESDGQTCSEIFLILLVLVRPGSRFSNFLLVQVRSGSRTGPNRLAWTSRFWSLDP